MQIFWIRFAGASFDVCMGEGSQILIRFGGAVGQGVVRGVIRCVYG